MASKVQVVSEPDEKFRLKIDDFLIAVDCSTCVSNRYGLPYLEGCLPCGRAATVQNPWPNWKPDWDLGIGLLELNPEWQPKKKI